MTKILLGGSILVGAVSLFLYALIAQDVPDERVADMPKEIVSAEPPVSEQQPVSGRDTLLAAMQLEGNLRCVFTATDTESQTEGTVWLADELFSLEAQTRAAGELYVSNMIRTDNQLYIWSGTAQGAMAIVMEAPENMRTWAEAETVPEGSGQEVDLSQEVAYECEPWTPEASVFIPPADIDFVDLEAMMQGMFDGTVRGTPEGLDF